MESALYVIFTLDGFVSEISLVPLFFARLSFSPRSTIRTPGTGYKDYNTIPSPPLPFFSLVFSFRRAPLSERLEQAKSLRIMHPTFLWGGKQFGRL